jgi:hypothetical protein
MWNQWPYHTIWNIIYRLKVAILGEVYFPHEIMCLCQLNALINDLIMQLLYVQVQALGRHIATYEWSHVRYDSVVLAMNSFPVSRPKSTVSIH